MSPFKNGSEIINQEFTDSFKPLEQIRLIPYPAIAELPFELYEAEYIKLTIKSKLSSISTALIGAFIVQCILIIRNFLENGFNAIGKNDIIIIILLFVSFIVSIVIDCLMNSEKRAIARRIKKHFKENKLHIKLQRKA